MFRYGILLEERADKTDVKCRIATVEENVRDHEVVVVSKRLFNYEPKLGDSVKIGLSENEDNEIVSVRKAADWEWLRDVSVFDGTVVIYAIVHIDNDDMHTTYVSKTEKKDGRSYYIFENSHTDFARIAITKKTVDHALSIRCKEQKPQPFRMYRVGLCRSPMEMQDGTRIKWRHYQDTPMVPIFELYGRDFTVPFISATMVYGVLDAIVIDVSDEGALFWSSRMGCAVLASVTTRDLPRIGSTFKILTKRCLADNGFNFPCFYELMPDMIQFEWKDITVYRNDRKRRLYIQTKAKCRKLRENENELAFMIPYFGLVKRGLEEYRGRLELRKEYECRLEFEQTGPNQPFEPVIKDILLLEDEVIFCKVVLVSRVLDKFFAFIDLKHDHPRDELAFVEIPARVLWCFSGRDLDDILVLSTVKARVTSPLDDQTVGRCVSILEIYEYTFKPNEVMRDIAGRGWLRTRASFLPLPYDSASPIRLTCQTTGQILLDQTRLSVKENLTRCSSVVVNAQCILAPGNVPVFLVRHIAPTFPELARLAPSVLPSLPSAQQVFMPLSNFAADLQNSLQNDDTFPSDASSAHGSSSTGTVNRTNRTGESSRNGRNHTNSSNEHSGMTRPGSPTFSVVSTRSYDTQIACESMFSENESIMSRNEEAPTILDEDEFKARHQELAEEEESMNMKSNPRGRFSTNSPGPSYSDPNYRTRPSIFGPRQQNSSYSSRSQNSRPSARGGKQRAGIRTHQGLLNDETFVNAVVYSHMRSRVMYETGEDTHIERWLRHMHGDNLNFKFYTTEVIGVELIDRRQSFHRNSKQKYEWLVRFYAKSNEIRVSDKMVIIPIGGHFADLPPTFELGKTYQAVHVSSPVDPVVRFVGFGKNPQPPDFFETMATHRLTNNCVIVEDNTQYLRIKVICCRPSVSPVKSNKFELWESADVEGLIIAETDEMILDDLEPETYDAYEMQCVIEPLAGGPFSITHFFDSSFFKSHGNLILWRVSPHFKDSKDYCKPICIKKVPVFKMEAPDTRPIKNLPANTSASTQCILGLSSDLTSQKMERLRANDDFRLRRPEDAELRPELENRKINELSRKNMLMDTLGTLKNTLPMAHKHGLFTDLSVEQLEQKTIAFGKMTDGDSFLITKRRSRAISEGCEFLIKLLKGEDVITTMHSSKELEPTLRSLADCIYINRTYVVKTESTKKMLDYFFTKKLCQRLL